MKENRELEVYTRAVSLTWAGKFSLAAMHPVQAEGGASLYFKDEALFITCFGDSQKCTI